jgi:hypothetical protein
VSSALKHSFPAFVRECAGRIRGYLVPGFFGLGFAEDREDMTTLIGQAVRTVPPMFHRVLVPLSQGELFHDLLRRGCGTLKVMSYMTVGEYRPPREVWMPSIGN